MSQLDWNESGSSRSSRDQVRLIDMHSKCGQHSVRMEVTTSTLESCCYDCDFCYPKVIRDERSTLVVAEVEQAREKSGYWWSTNKQITSDCPGYGWRSSLQLQQVKLCRTFKIPNSWSSESWGVSFITLPGWLSHWIRSYFNHTFVLQVAIHKLNERAWVSVKEWLDSMKKEKEN